MLYTLHIHMAAVVMPGNMLGYVVENCRGYCRLAVVTAGTLHIALVTPGCRLNGCFIVENVSDMVSPLGKEPVVELPRKSAKNNNCRHPHRCLFIAIAIAPRTFLIARSHLIFTRVPDFHALLLGCVWD